jgi:hypothetical protein
LADDTVDVQPVSPLEMDDTRFARSSEDAVDSATSGRLVTHLTATFVLFDRKLVVEELQRIKARHIIVGTVPSVTIAPIARGVRGKVRLGSRYFPYYTRPWIRDEDFDEDSDPHVTEVQARAIDSAIDAYNRNNHRLSRRGEKERARLVPVRPRRPSRSDGLEAFTCPILQRGRTGGPPIRFRPSWTASIRCRTRGSSPPAQPGAPTVDCSR